MLMIIQLHFISIELKHHCTAILRYVKQIKNYLLMTTFNKKCELFCLPYIFKCHTEFHFQKEMKIFIK